MWAYNPVTCPMPEDISLPDNSGSSVAIVDDEADFVKLLVMLLTKRGIQVSFVAYDGAEALELFKKADRKPDVILMDHHMRTMNGIEATRLIHLHCDDKKCKVIFLSADVHMSEEALNAGASVFLCKPASIASIINAINGV